MADIVDIGLKVDARAAIADSTRLKNVFVEMANASGEARARIWELHKAAEQASQAAGITGGSGRPLGPWPQHTAAIRAAREEMARFTAQATRGMSDAASSAEQLQARLNGVLSAQRAMIASGKRSTFLEGATRVTGGSLADIDPFSGGGISGGLPARAAQSAKGLGNVRQAVTSLAISAGALPGPLGRIGGSLGALAFGSPVVIGVLAAAAAIAYAWGKMREEGNRAKETMAALRSGQLGFTGGSLDGAVAIADAKQKALEKTLADVNNTIEVTGNPYTAAKLGIRAIGLKAEVEGARTQAAALRTLQSDAARDQLSAMQQQLKVATDDLDVAKKRGLAATLARIEAERLRDIDATANLSDIGGVNSPRATAKRVADAKAAAARGTVLTGATRDVEASEADQRRNAEHAREIAEADFAAKRAAIRGSGPNAGAAEALKLQLLKNQHAEETAMAQLRASESEGTTQAEKDIYNAKVAVIRATKAQADAEAERENKVKKVLTYEEQIKAAKQQLGNAAIDAIASGVSQRNPILGGAISGAQAGIMTGNPLVAATGAGVGALGGLISSILGMGAAARQARADAAAAAQATLGWLTAVKVANGTMTQGQANLDAFRLDSDRKAAEQRAIIKREEDRRRQRDRENAERNELGGLSGTFGPTPKSAAQIAAEQALAEIETEAAKRIRSLEMEARAIENINNNLRNAPSGFYLEKYLNRLGATTTTGFTRVYGDASGGSGSNGGGTKLVFNMPDATFTLSGANGDAVFKDFVQQLRRRAAASGGAGSSLADALDLM